jgi:hypothetical protein
MAFSSLRALISGGGGGRSNLYAIFGYGSTGSVSSLTNKVSNAGVVSSDTAGVGTARRYLAATSYG